MKLFISYSRDDKAWVYELWRQLLNEGHQPWIDRDIPPTADWWGTICENVKSCDCFVYVMTPKSVSSIFCLGEMRYAAALNKPVLPLMLKTADFPPELNDRRIQYQLITDEMSLDRVLMRIERGLGEARYQMANGEYVLNDLPFPDVPTPKKNPEHIYEVFALAEESAVEGNIAKAEQLFAQVIAADPDGLGMAAKERLQEILLERDRATGYEQVKRMAANPALLRGAQAAWRAFERKYSNFDPDNLAATLGSAAPTEKSPSKKVARPSRTESKEPKKSLSEYLEEDAERQTQQLVDAMNEDDESLQRLKKAVGLSPEELEKFQAAFASSIDIDSRILTPDIGERGKLALDNSAEAVQAIIGEPFEWCDVLAGEFLYGERKRTLILPVFAIAKYPITYSQFQLFIDDGGFTDDRWWEGLADRPDGPGEQAWKINDHPREQVSWYDSIAFCRWLSWKLGGSYDIDKVAAWAVRLPVEFEWEKAARGVDGRVYPWGNDFDQNKCNTSESDDKRTSSVMEYPQGMSSYGVFDMVGNIWEWCLTEYYEPRKIIGGKSLRSNHRRALRGGSWLVNQDFARVWSRSWFFPINRDNDLGFRIMRPL